MLEQLRKTVLAGLGAVLYTQEKVEAVIRDLIQKGQLTREQGAKFLEELVQKGEQGQSEVSEKIHADVIALLNKWKPVPRVEFEALRDRLEAVEKHLGLGERAAPDQGES
jgi:polyhydroxyalkanoate synthesis regulator phasin